jgi:hypothetical protein
MEYSLRNTSFSLWYDRSQIRSFNYCRRIAPPDNGLSRNRPAGSISQPVLNGDPQGNLIEGSFGNLDLALLAWARFRQPNEIVPLKQPSILLNILEISIHRFR